MSHGGQPSCTAVSLGKYVRRAFRAATGMKKRPKDPVVVAESSFSSIEEPEKAAAMKESVVRVVLRSGVVEVYPRVVLACTVIRKHPPGLCLAHPDVFRNPHGAVIRPLEPLFPGQKFLLIPESTVIRLKQRIPESSIGAFADDEDDDEEEEDEEEGDSDDYSTTTASSSEDDQGYSSGTTATASSEEEMEDAASAGDDDDGGFMARCCAREFYVANERWSKCQKLVDRGFDGELQSTDQPDRNVETRKKGKKKRRKGKTKKRRDRPAPSGLRTLTTPRRMWEPRLPAVEEEDEACFSPQSSPHPMISANYFGDRY